MRERDLIGRKRSNKRAGRQRNQSLALCVKKRGAGLFRKERGPARRQDGAGETALWGLIITKYNYTCV